MGNPRVRGLVIFGGMLVVAIFFCILPVFSWMPGSGSAVALPVITVPGEVVHYNWLFGVNLTNTMIGAFVTTIFLALMVGILWRVSKGWTQKVPGRLQGLFEVMVQTFYNFCYNIGGERLRTTVLLWPLVATIFFFLLAANYIKLLPGVETVGTMHCTYAGFNGYAMLPGWTDGSYRLWVDEIFDAGTTQTEETEHICNDYFKDWRKVYSSFPVETVAEIEAQQADFEAILFELEGQDIDSLSEEEQEEYERAEVYNRFAEERIESVETAEELESQIAAINAQIEDLEAHGDEDHGDDEEADAEEDVADAEGEDVLVAAEEVSVEDQLADLEEERATLEEAVDLAQTQIQYPEASVALSADALEAGAVPYLFHITPFVRGAATDLSLAFMLAILSIIVVQIYGVRALGPAYFEKFFNLSALGNLGKNPMGAVDFIAGLFEIISEIGKIVSLAFRLFGNLFAGGVALMAVTFLVALLAPMVIFGLELIIGAVQALVFAVLTLVFSVQAMESHHGDDHEHDAEHH